MGRSKNYDFRYLRVLVVDDSKFMTRVVQQILKSFGVGTVDMCHSGNEAYERAQDFEPDIIVSDWDMEHGAGPELIRRLRSDDDSKCKYVAVIMLTGFAERRRVVAARDFGITEFLTKPISAKALYSRMVAIVENPRPFVRSQEGYFGPDRRRVANQEYQGDDRRNDEIAMIG